MRRNDLFVGISILAIRRIWHGNFGRKYNKKHKIICRFYPSCSNYAIKSLEKHGVFKGWLLTYNRIKRCTNDNTESCIDYP
ncbi:MAG: membrane protein insertion efficiency factor YidD [Candidatus Aenigmarchaeota archaeon]|nr:membrane protein insertion efficiency factor YidD [Candidatus Aenigmarchaeota archaeon]